MRHTPLTCDPADTRRRRQVASRPAMSLTLPPTPILDVLPALACGTFVPLQRRARGPARRRQEHRGAACPARGALARWAHDPAAAAAPDRRTSRRATDGRTRRLRAGSAGRLPHASRDACQRGDAHRGRHGRHPDAPAAGRPRARAGRLRRVRRIPRAQPAVRPRAGARARRAAAPACGPPLARDVRDAGRHAGGRAARRRADRARRGSGIRGRHAARGAAR